MNPDQQLRAAALAAAVALNGQLASPAKLPTVISQAERILSWLDGGALPAPRAGTMD
jgi:hypothetical protein